MKRNHLLATLGLSLVTSLVGCASEGADEECLPGDVDCATSAGGKADGWDSENDPRYFANNLEYKLSSLPKKGNLTKPVWKDRYPGAMASTPVAWADTYWPSSQGSHNHRWMGSTVKSPLEKYDAAFNAAAGCETQPSKIYGAGAKAAWDTYYNCAGPAAKWQMKNFQGISKMHNGIDDNGDGTVDDYGSDRNKGIDGIQGWWGTCHAWSPAALMSPEPQHAVTLNGVKFEVGDIKALTQNIFDRTSAVMLGGRCNSEEITHDVSGSANDECSDVNPGSLHVIVTNFLGLRQAPLVEDRTANYEVWNQPMLGYEITKQTEVSRTAANTCVGQTMNKTKWSYNSAAKKLYEVRMTVTYLSESGAEALPVGWMNNTSQDDYHYILELNDAGKVIGGRYCTDSSNSHVDFLWSPTGTNSPSNPSVDQAKVKQLIKMSVEPESGGGGATGGTTKEFPVTPAKSIPDAAPAGVDIPVVVSGVENPKGLAVSVDISHSYRGDLVVKLLKNGVAVKTLVENTGGSADNLVETYTLTAAEIGTGVNTTWTVNVSDTEAQDVGTVNKVNLSFSL
jgi:hypothetical protein